MENEKQEDKKLMTGEEYLALACRQAAKALEQIMGAFDFERAADMLRAIGWKYMGASESPNAEQLKETARDIVQRVMQNGSRSSCHAGPLSAYVHHYDTPAVCTVDLYFAPILESAVYIDGRVILAAKQVPLDGLGEEQ